LEAKQLAAEKAVENVKDGMLVGLGTGSTAYWAIQKIGERVRQGLQIKCVATSVQSETLAKSLNIPIIPFSEVDYIDITIDGADEADKNKNLIKGGGGALLREKIVAFNSKVFCVIIDESKLVETLGAYPLPVEVIPFAIELTIRQLEKLGCIPVVRKSGDQTFITDNGNLIVDCSFRLIKDPAELNNRLKSIPGVVENGLFLNTMVTSIYVGYNNGKANEFN
jgi:ribose 5-phosphate isomerase A